MTWQDPWDRHDAEVEKLCGQSRILTSLDRACQRGAVAWTTSNIRRVLSRGGASSQTTRIRAAAIVVVIAAITALALSPLGTVPRPLAWLVPAAAGMLAVIVAVTSPAGRHVTSR